MTGDYVSFKNLFGEKKSSIHVHISGSWYQALGGSFQNFRPTCSAFCAGVFPRS